MPDNTQTLGTFRSSPLKQTDFKTWQEVFDAFAAGLISTQEVANIVQQVVTQVNNKNATVETSNTPVPNGANQVTVPVDATGPGVSVMLVNNTEAPVIGILAVNGSIVYLTGNAPTANYSVKVVTVTPPA